jgi:hypothetical protein
MNWIAIVLAIIVVLLFYILYRFFLLKSTELTPTANLNGANDNINIINNSTSLRYAYGIWVYVNSWDANTTDKIIFARNDNIELKLAADSPTLICSVAMSDTDKTLKPIEITNNFPLQKWVYIVVSVDGQYIDTYIDGKLVKSGRMYGTTVSSTAIPNGSFDSGTVVKLGTGWDAHVAKFTHWSEPVDPQTVWTNYMDGNGQSGTMKNFISSYGIDFTVLKDNVEQTKYSLF